MPKSNTLILLSFQILRFWECTVFCATMHSFLCKKERSCGFIEGRSRFSGRFQRDLLRLYKFLSVGGEKIFLYGWPTINIWKPSSSTSECSTILALSQNHCLAENHFRPFIRLESSVLSLFDGFQKGRLWHMKRRLHHKSLSARLQNGF